MNKRLEDLEDLWLWFEDEDILRGLEEPKYRRRRRGAGAAGGGTIITTPTPLIANDSAPIGAVVGIATVLGGSGTYTFTLTDPSGRFTIVGNQIQVASVLSPGFYPVTINASNGQGDNPSLVTTIFVSHVGAFVPTYHLYGF